MKSHARNMITAVLIFTGISLNADAQRRGRKGPQLRPEPKCGPSSPRARLTAQGALPQHVTFSLSTTGRDGKNKITEITCHNSSVVPGHPANQHTFVNCSPGGHILTVVVEDGKINIKSIRNGPFSSKSKSIECNETIETAEAPVGQQIS